MACYLKLCSSVAVTGFFLVFVMQRKIVVHKRRVTSNYLRATRVIWLSLLWDMYSQQMHLGNVLVFQSQCVKDAKSLLPTLTYSYGSEIKLFCQLLLPDFENPGLVLNSWTLVSSLQMLL